MFVFQGSAIEEFSTLPLSLMTTFMMSMGEFGILDQIMMLESSL